MSAAPPTASIRGSMVRSLPPVYHDAPPGGPAPLVERWVGALEQVLDPVVALLDNLPAHLDPRLAPDAMVEAMCAWVGMPSLDAVEVGAKRRLLAHAAEIADTRGTRHGAELVLRLAFPDETFTVGHSGAITTGDDPRVTVTAAPPEVTVASARPLEPDVRQAVLELLEDQRPAHARLTLTAGAGPP
jgi:phage tail-like protein